MGPHLRPFPSSRLQRPFVQIRSCSEVKVSQGRAPCRGSRGGSFPPLPASGGSRRPWACGRLPPVSPSLSHGHGPCSPRFLHEDIPVGFYPEWAKMPLDSRHTVEVCNRAYLTVLSSAMPLIGACNFATSVGLHPTSKQYYFH